MNYMISITSFYHCLKAVLQADVLRIVHEDQPAVSRHGVSSYADPGGGTRMAPKTSSDWALLVYNANSFIVNDSSKLLFCCPVC